MNQYNRNLYGYRLWPQNQMAGRIAKEGGKMAIDILEEMMNQNANSEQERQHNSRMAYRCKALIETRWQD